MFSQLGARVVSLALILTVSVLSAPHAQAAGSGRVVTDFVGSAGSHAEAVVVQPDGKVVVVGGSGRRFAVARYNSNGSLDQTFGTGGQVTTFIAGVSQGRSAAYAVAIQPDGRIIVAGSALRVFSNTAISGAFVLVRYNPDGSLDSGFGTGGIVITDFAVPNSDPVHRINDVALRPDGRILAVGTASLLRFALAQYNPDGSLDASFGNGGTVTTQFFNAGVAHGMVLRADGRVVAAGHTQGFPDFLLVQYNVNGSLDAGFGQGGQVLTDFANAPDFGKAAVGQPDGRVVVAGFSMHAFSVPPGDVELARYNENGSLDTGFGNGGKVTTDFAGTRDEGNGMALQGDGRIVVAGRAGNDFALARYNVNGSLDTAFGNGGKVTTDFANSIDFGTAVVIQRDGRIIVVGSTNNDDFALARYNPDGSLDTTFG